MDTFIWLVAANIAVWLGFGAYLAFLTTRQRGLVIRFLQWENTRRG